jgi:hypothetical protein
MVVVVGIESSLDWTGTAYCAYPCLDKCVMTAKYKIAGIWYTKPRLLRDANGEALPTRVGEFIDIGQLANYNSVGMKRVVDIIYDEDSKYFSVYFDKGGMKVIPLLPDTEILYEEINAKQQDKVK